MNLYIWTGMSHVTWHMSSHHSSVDVCVCVWVGVRMCVCVWMGVRACVCVEGCGCVYVWSIEILNKSMWVVCTLTWIGKLCVHHSLLLNCCQIFAVCVWVCVPRVLCVCVCRHVTLSEYKAVIFSLYEYLKLPQLSIGYIAKLLQKFKNIWSAQL